MLDYTIYEDDDQEILKFTSDTFENGLLFLLIELVNGNYSIVACELLKQESPDLLSNYVQNNSIDPKRHGTYVSWSKRNKREKFP